MFWTILIMLGLTGIFFSGIWHMDIMVGCAPRCAFTNGFAGFDQWQVYHTGLYAAIFGFAGMAVVACREIGRVRKHE